MEQAEVSTPIRLRAPLFSVKRVIARIICHPLIGRIISLVFRDRIPSRGSLIHTKDKAVVPSVKAALFWGLYESAEVRFVKEFLRSDLDVIELGSSLGVVTSQILRKVKAGSRIVCVEANPYLLATLRKNIEENREGRQVTIVHGAIAHPSANGKSINLLLGDDNTVSQVVPGYTAEESIPVPAFTLSTILRDEQIMGDFALVSDIEGAEASFIETDDLALVRCQQMIIELHETRWEGMILTVDQLRQRLEQLRGFRLRANYGPVCVFERTPESF